MKKVLVSLAVLAALALGGGRALAATHHHAPKTLVIAMHDPGCHWFLSHGSFAKTASVAGPVRVANRDEATLKVASRTAMRYIRVGRSIVLKKGHYVVMMVGQAVDDNYLKLTVK